MNESKAVIIADYKGLTVHEMEDLRMKLREAGGQLSVIKNTLARLALGDMGVEELGDDLTGTVSLVKAEIDRLKQDYMGLGFVFGSYLATLLQPFGLMKRFVRFLFSRMIASGNMPPALTNMGIIDEAKLDFGAPELASAVICVPVNQPPLFVTGLSGFRGSLTMSCGFYESALPADRVELLYRRIDSELPG